MTIIDRAAIEAAYGVIRPHIRVTPTLALNGADFGLDPFTLTLKLEQLQHAGAFKTRGAFANLLMREIPAAGVAAASGGNHGAAVAYAAMRLGVAAKIFVPTVSSPAKVERIRSYGAEFVITGETYSDSLVDCERWIEEHGAMPVHAFDQRETLLGTGTIGLELESQVRDAGTVLAGVGGGGLIGGIAAWFAGSPTKVIGVEPYDAPTLTHALAAGEPVDAPTGSIARDSLAPRRIGALMLPIAQQHIERVLLVTDDEILESQRALWRVARIVAEPGGAAAFAAILARRYVPAVDEHVAVVISGANTTAVQF
jgi:threonine dehydratase